MDSSTIEEFLEMVRVIDLEIKRKRMRGYGVRSKTKRMVWASSSVRNSVSFFFMAQPPS